MKTENATALSWVRKRDDTSLLATCITWCNGMICGKTQEGQDFINIHKDTIQSTCTSYRRLRARMVLTLNDVPLKTRRVLLHLPQTVLGQLPTKDNSQPDKYKAHPLPTGTTIPRTIAHQDNSPLGPLPRNKTTHQDQYMYGGELSWWGVVQTQPQTLYSNRALLVLNGTQGCECVCEKSNKKSEII